MKRLGVLALTIALVGCGGAPKTQDLSTIKEDLMESYRVSDAVVEGDGHLVITMALPDDSDYERVANRGFNDIGDMLNHVIQTYPDVKTDTKQVYITFNASLLDNNNAQKVEPVFDVFFDTDKLATFDGGTATTFYDYLRVAKISIRQPIGHDIIETWCQGDNNQRDFKNICQ